MARSTAQRVIDTQQKLAEGGDAWLATASENGPHLVPFSFAWDEDLSQFVFCTEARSRTVRNIGSSSTVQVAVGSTRDVVLVRGTAEVTGPVKEDPSTAAVFAAKTGWDPTNDSGDWVFIRVTASTIQAWRNVDEISGRIVMKNGTWNA